MRSDPAIPQRDLLLDPAAMRAPLQEALGAPLDGCAVERVKYRVGESLRVLYRIELDGSSQLVSLRTFEEERARREAMHALARAVPADGVAPVGQLAGLGAVVWTFPNDRKLSPPPASDEQQVVAYAPEVRVTLRRDRADGRPVAYLKHLAGREGERLLTLYGTLCSRATAAGGPRLGRALGLDPDAGVLWLAPVDGGPVDDRDGMRAFGEELARLHRLPPERLPYFERLRPAQVASAARIVAAARPDAAEAATALARALRTAPAPAEPEVLLHGDAHPKNCLLGEAGATLIDLDQASVGPASADLGGVLARLLRDLLAGRLDAAEAAARGESFLEGYARHRPLPPPESLAWHQAAALLVESALRAVNRVYGDALAVLDQLLAGGLACLEGSRA